jgi:ankyrin repeat protein
MERIQRQRGDLPHDALLILSWVVKARTQLTVPELKEAIAVEIGKSKLDKDNIPTIDHMIQACAPLIVVDRESNIVRLVHYTRQEYFEQPHNIWMREAHIKITNVCMTYMSFLTFQEYIEHYHYTHSVTVKEYYLYGYAARYWEYHTHKALAQGLDVLKVVEFLERVKEDSWLKFLINTHLADVHKNESQSIDFYRSLPTGLTALHIAACFGWYDVAIKLLAKGYDPNAKDTELRTSLWWAASNGHSQVVELLLGLDVDLETKDSKDFETPLSAATRRDHEVVVKLLLDTGADPESQSESVWSGSGSWTPLAWAVKKGYESIANLLIAKNANIDAKDHDGQTPLSLAIISGSEVMVKFLLARGANQEVEDCYGYTPLCHAVCRSQIAITKLFINNGANLKHQNGKRAAILHLAMFQRSEHIVSLLIESNAIDVNAIDCDGCTPLFRAVRLGRENNVAALLVSKEVDVELTDKSGKSPIAYAKEKGYAELLQMLLRYKRSKDDGSSYSLANRRRLGARSKHLLSTGDTYESPAKRRLPAID